MAQTDMVCIYPCVYFKVLEQQYHLKHLLLTILTNSQINFFSGVHCLWYPSIQLLQVLISSLNWSMYTKSHTQHLHIAATPWRNLWESCSMNLYSWSNCTINTKFTCRRLLEISCVFCWHVLILNPKASSISLFVVPRTLLHLPFLQTSAISEAMFSPSLSPSVHNMRCWHFLASCSSVF